MTKFAVGAVAASPPGSQRRLSLDGREIAIFNVDGRFRALRDVCPHQGAELSAGTVVRSVVSTGPGCYQMVLWQNAAETYRLERRGLVGALAASGEVGA